MSEIDANPAPRPPSVYEAEHPGSSLAIWATALILQIGMYPLFFLFDQRGFSDSIRAMVETVLGIIWLLIRSPRGLGLDLRTRRLKTAATTAGSPPSRAQFPCVSSQSPPGDFLRLLLRLQSPATGRRRDSRGFRMIPFASILGVRFGVVHLARRPTSVAAWAGIIFNTFNLLTGAFLWMLLLTGVRV